MLVDRLQEIVEGIFERRPYIPEQEVEIPITPEDFWKWFEKNTTPHPDIQLPGELKKAMEGLPPIIGNRTGDQFELYRGCPGNAPTMVFINRSYIPTVELHGLIEVFPTGTRVRYSFYRVSYAKGTLILLTLVFGVVWAITLNSMRQPPINLFEVMIGTGIPILFGGLWTAWTVQSRSERGELESFLLESQSKQQ